MDDGSFKGDAVEGEELDLDSEDGASLDDVMKEALDAVERPSHQDGSSTGPFEISGGADERAAESLRREVEELRDRSMRTLADFDNFRKRVDRERREQRQYAGSEVLRELLAVVDNLERAVQAQGSLDEMKQGVELILRQVEDLLKHHGVERVLAKGEKFDPSAHEAVARHESDEVEEPMIAKELQAGYWLRDRLLRPALVEVAVPKESVSTVVEGANGSDESEA